MELAAVICAHNPRRDYFSRVLNALRDQTLPKNQWELIIVDNASKVPLASDWDISWHPNGRQVVESELGLAAARRRGMRETACELIVFIDDDNVLNSDYLSEALQIKREWPLLGHGVPVQLFRNSKSSLPIRLDRSLERSLCAKLPPPSGPMFSHVVPRRGVPGYACEAAWLPPIIGIAHNRRFTSPAAEATVLPVGKT